MASSLPFAFDALKLNNFVNGDIGIADTIFNAQIKPIIDSISDEKMKAQFIAASLPNKKTGLHALEKTVVSSMLEAQKPFIEMVKIFLELFGSIEIVTTMITGGANPAKNPNSFSGAFASNIASMESFGKPQVTNTATTTIPEPIPPQKIFLGKFKRNLPYGNVTEDDTVTKYGEYTLGHTWPQYQSYSEFSSEETDKIVAKTIEVTDQDTKTNMINGRTGTFGDEWSTMTTDNQIEKNFSGDLGSQTNISKYYKPYTINYLNNDIEIDIEGDYDIQVEKIIDNQLASTNPYYYDYFYIYATIKPDAAGAAGSSSSSGPSSFTGGPKGLIQAIKTFLKTTLNIIIKKLMPIIASIQQIISNPVAFIGNILMTKIKEHFEMFDLSLKGTPAGNKYWSGDKFVQDGIASIDIGILKMTLSIQNGLPTFKPGTTPIGPGVIEQPMLKQVASLVAMPINMLKGILDAVKELMKKLFVVPNLGSTMTDFISLNWIKDLLKMPDLLKLVGATGNINDGTFKIPFLTIPTTGNLAVIPDMIKAFIKMLIGFFNGFISIPNTILNIQLVPPIPLPI